MQNNTQYTRCPQCETAFKVNQKMLSMAHGKVRCGACLKVFQATDYLLKPREKHTSESVLASSTLSQPSSEPSVDKPLSGDSSEARNGESHEETSAVDVADKTTESSESISETASQVDSSTLSEEPVAIEPESSESSFADIGDELDDDIDIDGFAEEFDIAPAPEDLTIQDLSESDEEYDEQTDNGFTEPAESESKESEPTEAQPTELETTEAKPNESEPTMTAADEALAQNQSDIASIESDDLSEFDELLEPEELLESDNIDRPDELLELDERHKQSLDSAVHDSEEESDEDFDEASFELNEPDLEDFDGNEKLAENLVNQINETDTDIDPLDEFEGRVENKKTTLRNAIIGASIGVLFIVLIVNFWINRQTLAWDETWGGATKAVCAMLPCDLKPRRDIAKIRTLQRIVTPSDEDESVLDIKLLLTNEASFDQPYPLIAIKFSNSQGQEVAQKQFTVTDYNPQWQNQLMPAGAEIPIIFSTELPHPDALGFEIVFQ